MVESNIRGRMADLEQVRTWEKNPQLYGDVLASSLAGQIVFGHAPLAERARRVLSKLRQAPRLVQAARENIKDPPGIFVKIGLETFRGALKFIQEDVPRAFATLDDLHLLGDLADGSAEAVQALGSYIEYLENEVAPRARASFRLGRELFEQKLRLDEGIALDADRLLAIATREMRATQEEFRRAARRIDGGNPVEAWRRAKLDHPRGGRTGRCRRPAARGSGHLHRSPRGDFAAGRRPRPGGPDARVLPLVVREHVGARAVRDEADPGVLLPDRRRSVVAGGTAGGAPPAFQLPDALGHLDPRGLPRPLPPLPAPPAGRVEGAQVDHVLAGVLRRGLGALLRADDDRGGVQAGRRHRSGWASWPRR